MSGSFLRARLDRKDHFGARHERVLAQPHRHAARVARDAFKRRGQARCAIDRGDGADRQVLRLEHWTLLDVQLHEGRDAACAQNPDALGIAAKLFQRVAQRDPLRVPQRKAAGGHEPGERARAGHGGGKAHALFVAERDESTA